MEDRTDESVGRVIFSNSQKKLAPLLEGRQRKILFLVMENSPRYGQITDYLVGLDDCEEVDLSEETRSLRPGFSDKYIGLLAEINQANASFWWWAFYFTRKESVFTNLAQRIFYCYLIGKVIKRSPSFDIVVITDDRLLAAQMGSWSASRGRVSISALSSSWGLKERIKSFALARIGYTLLRALHYWLMVKVLWRVSLNPGHEYVMMGTLIDERCFAGDDGYRDVYLGELPEFMSRNGARVLIYGGILWGTWKALKAMRKRPPDFPVLPWYYFSTIPGILGAAWQSLTRYISPITLRGEVVIDGIPVDYLIKDAMRRNLRSGQFFESMWVYHAAQALAKRLKISACVFPYENRSWEKMLMAGLASGGRSIRSVGYHHAAISPAHTNLLLGPDEAPIIPLPDVIVMAGDVTKELLETTGNYPEGMLKVGCALRQGRGNGRARPRHSEGKVANVLVAMATTEDEYVDTLLFLEEALLGFDRYKIGVRPHPEISVERALLRLPHLRLNFQLMDGPLDTNLDWADVVVYVSSTVGLDAVSVGIPAISIDLGNFIGADPAPEDCPLKWSVTRPDQLVPAFQQIEEISNSEFKCLQRQATGFGTRYFRPVTDESLKAFSDLVMETGQATK